MTTVDQTLPALPARAIDLRGLPIHAVTQAELITLILNETDAGRGGWVVPTNLDVLRQYVRSSTVAEICSEATFFVADGAPLVWASRLQGTPLPERVAGSTLITRLSGEAAERGRSVFLLGGDAGTAKAASAHLRGLFPSLDIKGALCPPFGFEKDDDAMRAVETALHSAQPDIVFVALGFPKQERLIRHLKNQMPHAWWIGVGISFSFLSGRVKRAPLWMQRAGLEWVHRLAQEPRRLARRYLRDGIPFAARLLASSAWRGLHRARVDGSR